MPIGSPSRRTLVQIIGFAIGLALLGWCIVIALRPENREQLERLRAAGPAPIAGLLGLSALSLLANGTVFWSLIQPAVPLRFWHVQMANSIATCLAYLPFKLSIVFRFYIHRTRDQIPLPTIAAWIAAAAASLLAAFAPIIAVLALMPREHPLAYPCIIAAVAACAGIALAIARAFAGPRGLARVRSLASATRLSLAARIAGSQSFAHLHAGFDMVGEPKAWSGAIVGRLLDLAIQTWRFALAASILGLDLPPSSALLLALTYYTIGAASPSGALGAREGGAAWLAVLLHLDGAEHYAAVPLLVTAADTIPTVCCAAISAGILRLWKPSPRAEERPASPPV